MSNVLLISPKLDETGGVQVSGRQAQLALGCHAIQVDAHARRTAVIDSLRYDQTPDVVLVWHLSLLRLLPLLRLSKRSRVVVFLHGIEAWTPGGALTRLLMRRVDVFLVNSHLTWQRFAAAYPGFALKPHRVVQLGLGEPVHATPPRPLNEPVALMLGRLVRSEDYKGHRQLIAAWPTVRQRLPGAELWIAGDGDLKTELELIAGDGVTFFGAVSEDEKQRLISSSRCLALPSRAEGFGLVYLEAMRLGRPCLISMRDAAREVVNPPEAGIAADPDDRDALVHAVSELLTGWDTWSHAAQQRYARQFTAAAFAARLRAALDIDDVWDRRRTAA